MRYILTGFLFCVTLFNYAQVVDDFSDGDLSANPTWIGDTVNFEVDSNQKLHLDAPGVEDTSYAATVSSLVDDAEWTFLVDLDFNPSSANLARVYLMANQSDLKQSLNGYFVAIGGTSDEVSLYKQTGTAVTEIIDGIDDLVDSDPVSVRVKVSRTSAGEWTLKADNSGGFNFSNQGTVIDITHTSATYFGVFCKYTSTRSDKFYFDDIIIEPMTLVDTIAPQITSVDVVSDQVIVLWFTEKVDQFTAENTLNYTANNGLGSPSLAEVLAATPQAVELTFPPSFQEGVGYTLSVQNIQDDSGNVMLNSTIDFMYNIPFFGAYKDVVITEFMADPNPSVGLPEAEYLEIFNNTSQTISLENWTLSDGSTTITLADQPFLPQTYLLCFDPSSGASYGIINTIEGPIPTLNNSGDIIVLRDNNGLVIDSVAYSIGWYQDAQKALGGWSLELKNIDSPCHDPSNWGVSENATGGTPGYENSIYTNAPNTQAPRIQEVYIENDSVIYFVFDKNIESGNVSINPVANLSLVLIGSELKVTVSNFNLLETYQLTVAGFSDCWGNIMNDFTYLFAIPEAIEKGDVIINEVLFNPATGGSDYIEVVNISDKVLAINNLQIANIDE